MGKPTGQHPLPITSTQNPKMDPKIGLASLISALCCTPSLASCRGPKSGQIWPSILQNLVKGQQLVYNKSYKCDNNICPKKLFIEGLLIFFNRPEA